MPKGWIGVCGREFLTRASSSFNAWRSSFRLALAPPLDDFEVVDLGGLASEI
jgi:hypothetical protein